MERYSRRQKRSMVRQTLVRMPDICFLSEKDWLMMNLL